MIMPLLYLIAGEASGDALGAGLMRELRALRPEIHFAGIGGEAMQREGLKSLFPYSDLSIMGFSEIVPHIPKLLRHIRETVQDIAKKQPAAIVTIDSPGFNFSLAKALINFPKTNGIGRIHYVAPSVWAYKPSRAKKTAALFDMLLALLPFEPPFFEKEGLPTLFTGHPVLWEVQKGDDAAFRARHTLAVDTPLLLLLPGSRAGEVKRHLPLFLKASESLPRYKTIILASPQVKELIQNTVPSNALVIDIAEKQDAFAATTFALSKSGTITLELAAAGVPMIVAHKVSVLSAWLIRKMALIPYVSLVNIAVSKEIVPELLQERCTVPQIVKALTTLAKPEIRDKQRKDCTLALEILRGGTTENPHHIAAKAILSFVT